MGISKIILFIAIPLAPAHAAEKAKPFQLECESLESLAERITACSRNRYAVESARQCFDRLMQAWNDAPKELNRILSVSKARKNTKQDAELGLSKGDYEKTVAKMENLLAVTERNTQLIADYPRAMLNDPDFRVNCFTDRFDRIQEIVYELDDRLMEGERTLAAAAALKGISLTRQKIVGSDSAGPKRLPTSLPSQVKASPVMKSGKSAQRRSDITGTERSRQKEILTNFKLRDQLTSP
jgi:hypothetical protein